MIKLQSPQETSKGKQTPAPNTLAIYSNELQNLVNLLDKAYQNLKNCMYLALNEHEKIGLMALEDSGLSVQQFTRPDRLVHLTIHQASNLLAKDPKNTCNPYVMVSVDGYSCWSLPIEQNQDPKWEFKCSIPVNQENLVSITCWNRDSTSFDRNRDSFLGMVEIQLLPDLIVAQQWIDLKKRSSRSNVRGQIQVSCSIEPADWFQPRRLLYTPKSKLDVYVELADYLIAENIEDLLDFCSQLWKISPIDKNKHSIQLSVKQYVNGIIKKESFKSRLLECLPAGTLCESNDLFTLVHGILCLEFNEFYSEIFNERPIDSTQLDDSLKILHLIDPSQLQVAVQSLVSQKIEFSFNCTEIQEFNELSEKCFKIINAFSGSSISATVIEFITSKLAKAVPSFEFDEQVDLIQGFQFVRTLSKIQQFDHDTFFKIENISNKLLGIWIEKTESKLTEWMKNALLMDKWDPISPSDNHLYSNSVVDLLCMIHQPLDFIKEHESMFTDFAIKRKLAQLISNVILEYSWSLYCSFKTDLMMMGTRPSNLPPKTSRFKPKKPIKERLDLNHKALVKMNNLLFIKEKVKFNDFQEKCDGFDVLIELERAVKPKTRPISFKLASSDPTKLYRFASSEWIEQLNLPIRCNLLADPGSPCELVIYQNSAPGKTPYLVSRNLIQLEPTSYRMNDILVKIRETTLNCNEYLCNRVKSYIDRLLYDMTILLVDKICQKPFKIRTRDNKLKALLKKEKIHTLESVESELDSLFDCLNSAFGTLNEFLIEEACLDVLKECWKRLNMQIQHVLVGDFEVMEKVKLQEHATDYYLCCVKASF